MTEFPRQFPPPSIIGEFFYDLGGWNCGINMVIKSKSILGFWHCQTALRRRRVWMYRSNVMAVSDEVPPAALAPPDKRPVLRVQTYDIWYFWYILVCGSLLVLVPWPYGPAATAASCPWSTGHKAMLFASRAQIPESRFSCGCGLTSYIGKSSELPQPVLQLASTLGQTLPLIYHCCGGAEPRSRNWIVGHQTRWRVTFGFIIIFFFFLD